MDAQTQTQRPRSSKPQWTVVKEFADEPTGLVVEISALSLWKGRQFNWTLSQRGDGRTSRFMRPRVTPSENPGLAGAVAKDGMVAARLIDEALLWIEQQTQADIDFQFEVRMGREERQIEREQRGPEKKAGLSKFVEGPGKTEREAAKRAKHEQNLAARRAEDQARTSKSKGK